jgi:carboxylesterase
MRGRESAESAPILAGAGTIDLQEVGPDSDGALLLHGFGDTPQTLSGLAQRLHKNGFSVLAPLLPGHGRTMRDFRASRANQWVEAADSALSAMLLTHRTVSMVGLSMGGAIATVLAARTQRLRSLVLIAPYLGMPRFLRVAAATHWLWGKAAGEVNARNPHSIRNPIEREKNLAYGAVTGRQLYELLKVVRQAREALPLVSAPTLLIQSREDPRIAPAIAERSLEILGAREKKLVWTEGAGHIITVDYGRERVFTETESWLKVHAQSGATAARKTQAAVERQSS